MVRNSDFLHTLTYPPYLYINERDTEKGTVEFVELSTGNPQTLTPCGHPVHNYKHLDRMLVKSKSFDDLFDLFHVKPKP